MTAALRCLTIVAGLCLAAGMATQAWSQVLYGSIVGVVSDPTQAAVPRASITVTNTATGLSRHASSDDLGYFSIPNLPPGPYDVSVTASGFRVLTRRGVDVRANVVTTVDVTLEVGTLAESVTPSRSP